MKKIIPYAKIEKNIKMIEKDKNKMYGTTVLFINKKHKKKSESIIIADGQVSLGHTVVKNTANKVKKLNDDLICGFAGSVSDAFVLVELLEKNLAKLSNNLKHACIEVTKNIREERGKKEAMMIVANKKEVFIITGDGSVLEPQTYNFKNCEFTVAAIGSGGNFALSGAMSLCNSWKEISKNGHSFSVEDVAKKSMTVAADICIYTNNNFVFEKLNSEE